MTGLLLLVLLFIGVIGGFYAAYLIRLVWRTLHGTASLTEYKPVLCFFGLHSWGFETSEFSSAMRCGCCPAVRNEQEWQRLEYERELWDKEAQVRGIRSDDSKKLVAIKLSEWDRRVEREQRAAKCQ